MSGVEGSEDIESFYYGWTGVLTIFARPIRLYEWMRDAVLQPEMALERKERISEVVKRERSRLLEFIRRRVPDGQDAEDVLQDVFSRLVEANALLMPIEQATGWLYRVARNRITDLPPSSKPSVVSV